ncbi:hypothetical protein BGZ83_009787 [Gryganskiella cystojenkinii]|nr:hypothetical protein BGZ83_009787 [Gryganskiella cystojenkinii]
MKALLELFRSLPQPKDIKRRERALFHQLICATQPIVLNATDLNGRNKTSTNLGFTDFDTLETGQASLEPGYEKVLCRWFQGYPRFDYMLGGLLMQVSISDFQSHNVGTADISKAFVKGFNNNPKQDQIEFYLDDLFGAKHNAVIRPNVKFEVRRNRSTVPGFRIVYIRGSPGKPMHSQSARRFPDVAHISYEEIKEKLFTNIV